MIVTTRIGVRIAAILLVAVVLQVSFFSQLSLLGAAPDMLVVVVVALGLLGGAVLGAVCGFAAGLLLDSVLLQTLGASSLVLVAAGYLAGRYRESFDVAGVWIPVALSGALAAFTALAFGAIQLMLGVEAQVSLLILREVIVKGLLGGLFALAVYPLMRRLLRPALVDPAPARGGGVLSRARGRSARRGGGAARLQRSPAQPRVRGGVA